MCWQGSHGGLENKMWGKPLNGQRAQRNQKKSQQLEESKSEFKETG